MQGHAPENTIPVVLVLMPVGFALLDEIMQIIENGWEQFQTKYPGKRKEIT